MSTASVGGFFSAAHTSGQPSTWAIRGSGLLLGRVKKGLYKRDEGERVELVWTRCGDEQVGVQVVRRGSHGARF